MTKDHGISMRFIRILFTLGCLIGLFVLPHSVAFAQKAEAPTLISIVSEDQFRAGKSGDIVVRLTTTAGAPIAAVGLDLALGNSFLRATATDNNGRATFTLSPNISAGIYHMTVSFRGAPGFQPTSLTQEVMISGEGESHLQIEPLDNIPLDVNAFVTARLTGPLGQPLAGERVELLVDGQRADVALTDRNGNAHLHIGKDISVGQHKLVVVYNGSPRYQAVSATQMTGVRGLAIEIHTVPVIQGARFSFQGQVYTSDKDGILRIPVSKPGIYEVEALPFQNTQGDMKAEFSLWGDETLTPAHQITVPASEPTEVGYDVSYLVRQTFVDLDNKPVDPQNITGSTFKRSDGLLFQFQSGETQWLKVSHVLRRVFGLAESPFLYSLMSVTVHGTNVVSAQQQRFYVHPGDVWQLQLLLYAANFHSHDMLFGFPLGSGIKVEYPDGTIVQSRMDSSASTEVRSLPRGDYRISVSTWFGISPVSPLAMSRNQDVDLPIVSYLDLFTLLLLAVLIGPGVLYVGQPGLRRAIRNGTIWRSLRNPREWEKVW